MAIAFDSAVDGGDNGGSGVLSFSFNNVAGDLVLVGCMGDAFVGSVVDDITPPTYNSVAMFEYVKLVPTTSGARVLQIFGMVAPATGSHTVAFASYSHYVLAGAVSYSGCSQSGQPNATNSSSTDTGSQSSSTLAITTVADNSWPVMLTGGFSASGAPTAGAGSTRRVFGATFGNWGFFDSNAPKTPAGSYSMTWTYAVATATPMDQVIVAIKPPVPGPGAASGMVQHLRNLGAY